MEGNIGQRVKIIIRQKGFDVKRVAGLMGKYEQWLASKLSKKDPGISFLLEIAKVIGMSEMEFLQRLFSDDPDHIEMQADYKAKYMQCLKEKAEYIKEIARLEGLLNKGK